MSHVSPEIFISIINERDESMHPEDHTNLIDHTNPDKSIGSKDIVKGIIRRQDLHTGSLGKIKSEYSKSNEEIMHKDALHDHHRINPQYLSRLSPHYHSKDSPRISPSNNSRDSPHFSPHNSPRDIRDIRDIRDSREIWDVRVIQDSQEIRGGLDTNDTNKARNTNDPKDTRYLLHTQDSRNRSDSRYGMHRTDLIDARRGMDSRDFINTSLETNSRIGKESQRQIVFSDNVRKKLLRPLIIAKKTKLLVELRHNKKDEVLLENSSSKSEELHLKVSNDAAHNSTNFSSHSEKLEPTETHTSSKSETSPPDIELSFYYGPSLHIQKGNIKEYFKIEKISNTKLILEVVQNLPPDLICSFIEFQNFGVIGASSSGKSTGVGVQQAILSMQDQTLLDVGEFHSIFLGSKRKATTQPSRKKQRVTEYDGVEISEWVQMDDDDIELSFVDNQLHEPGDGVCLFNWVSFRCAAAKRIKERVEREKKSLLRKNRKRKTKN